MNVLVILGHQQAGSFNHAIAATVVRVLKDNGHTVTFHDLYAEHFPAILPAEEVPQDNAFVDPVIQQHCEELTAAEGIVIVHPNWWGMPPAILKGWVDRVFRPGVAYEFSEGDLGGGVPTGLLTTRLALVLNTSNTEDEREQLVFGDPLEALWVDCIFGFCGVPNVHRRNFSIIIDSTLEQRQGWLREVEALVNELFPVS
ncbi:MAG: NAD(P)H-dependent oxidoreductase [Chloroflexi bacterium]|nr:NAD(P)H-dependent oxidoreductase [Chloroflexota bacterium]